MGAARSAVSGVERSRCASWVVFRCVSVHVDQDAKNLQPWKKILWLLSQIPAARIPTELQSFSIDPIRFHLFLGLGKLNQPSSPESATRKLPRKLVDALGPRRLAWAIPPWLRVLGSPNLAHSRPSSNPSVCRVHKRMGVGISDRNSSRGQTRLYREFLLPRRPLGSYNEKEYLFNTQSAEMSPIRESLHSVLQIRVSVHFGWIDVRISMSIANRSSPNSSWTLVTGLVGFRVSLSLKPLQDWNHSPGRYWSWVWHFKKVEAYLGGNNASGSSLLFSILGWKALTKVLRSSAGKIWNSEPSQRSRSLDVSSQLGVPVVCSQYSIAPLHWHHKSIRSSWSFALPTDGGIRFWGFGNPPLPEGCAIYVISCLLQSGTGDWAGWIGKTTRLDRIARERVGRSCGRRGIE